MLNSKIYKTENSPNGRIRPLADVKSRLSRIYRELLSGKNQTTKKLFAFIIMVFSVSLADAQCVCYCTNNGQPKYNAICVTNPNNGNSYCKHVGPRYCGARIDNATSTPDETSLTDIYPNPVSTSTSVSFYIEETENVSLKIFDVNGRLVTTLADASFEEGDYEIIWNATEVNSGIYFLRFETATYSENQKLIVAK